MNHIIIDYNKEWDIKTVVIYPRCFSCLKPIFYIEGNLCSIECLFGKKK